MPSKPHPHPSMSWLNGRDSVSVQRRTGDGATRAGGWGGTADGTVAGYALLPSAKRCRRPGEGLRATCL